MTSGSAIRVLASLLEARTGQQVAPSRHWRIESSLKPLLRAEGLDSLDGLINRLLGGHESKLADAIVEALLNNETSFFRDQGVFQLLDGQALEAIRTQRAGVRRLRIWCAGCSTGQEAYSLALGFFADVPRWAGWQIEIVATDVSGRAIDQAQKGEYTQFEIQRGLPVGMMIGWFDQQRETWIAKPELRAAVRFRRHNMLDGPPTLEPFDAILCRNVLLYFAPDVRTRAFAMMRKAIAPDGVLMLGAGETVIGQTEAFAASRRWRGLYRPAGAESEDLQLRAG